MIGEIGVPKNARFVFIDALRGGAALAVLLYHLANINVLSPVLHRAFGFVAPVFEYGKFGVQVFFVLSGFVIAHSLRHHEFSRGAIGNFIVRRQLRLDPPYWCVIALALLLHEFELHLPGIKTEPLPAAPATLFNFFYLQYILGAPSILNVAWTLCLEIQFYLVFIALLGCAALLPQRSTRFAVWLVFLSGALSLLLALAAPRVDPATHHAWFGFYWFYFAAGVLCYWSSRQSVPRVLFGSFLVFWGIAIIALLWRGLPTDDAITAPALITGILTVLAIDFAGRGSGLFTRGSGALWQYLGRISYSLYLVHVSVLLLVMRVGYKISGENARVALLWFGVAGVFSIGAAHILYRVVETPSMKWAALLKRREYSREEIIPLAQAEAGAEAAARLEAAVYADTV